MKSKHPLPIDWTSVCRMDSQLLETHLTMNFSSYQFIANYSNHSLFRIETLKRHVILPRCMDTDQCRQILHYHRIGVFQFLPSTICNRVKLPIKIIDQFTYYCKRINGNVGNRGEIINMTVSRLQERLFNSQLLMYCGCNQCIYKTSMTTPNNGGPSQTTRSPHSLFV